MTFLFACGGGPTPELGLSGPASAEVIWGSASSLELSLERNEAALGEVSLSVEGLPDGVTGRFEPATLSDEALATTLRLEAARDAAGGFFTVTVRATDPDALVATHAFTLEVKGLTIEGRVDPIAGARGSAGGLVVKVGSRWVATDHQGRFVAHQVAPPYDLVLMGSVVTEIYTDLTTTTPHVKGFIDPDMFEDEDLIDVRGTITPTPETGERVTVCTDAIRPLRSICTSVTGDGARNTYEMFVPHRVGEQVKLYARRELRGGDHVMLGFTGYAEAALPADPENIEVIDFTITPSSSNPISFSLDRGERSVVELVGQVSYGPVLSGNLHVASDVFHLPQGAQGSLLAMVGDVNSMSITLQPVHGPLDGPITFVEPVALISPPESTALDDDTEFVTDDPQGTLVSHTFITDGQLIAVHTFGDRVRFTDLAAHLEDLRPADLRQWYVTTTPSVTSPEQALQETVGYLGLTSLSSGGFHETLNARPLRMGLHNPRSLGAPAGPVGAAGAFVERLVSPLLH